MLSVQSDGWCVNSSQCKWEVLSTMGKDMSSVELPQTI